MPKFDLAKTAELSVLFETPRENRDANWIQQFYAAVPDASMMSFTPQVQQGPDQFPYFHMSIPGEGPFTTFCVTHVLDYVLDNGFGMAIFGDPSRSDGPQWVFTYGDLLSFSLYGRFDGNPADQAAGSATATGEGRVLQAAPSEAISRCAPAARSAATCAQCFTIPTQRFPWSSIHASTQRAI